VAHFNTEHPHVHVAVRGMSGGEPLRFRPAYIKSGIREAAENLCTVQLGPRTQLDAVEAERREVTQQRFTSLDRIIGRASDAPESWQRFMWLDGDRAIAMRILVHELGRHN